MINLRARAQIALAISQTILKFVRTTLPKDLMRHYVIVCLSFPLHVGWGLPFTFLSVLGNIIFAPFLSLMLLGSTAYMVCFFAGLPYLWTVWPLEKLVSAWLWILKIASSHTFVSCPCPSKAALFICCACMGVLLHLRITKKRLFLKICALSITIACFWGYALACIPCNKTMFVEGESQISTYLDTTGSLVITCQGRGSHKRSLDTWIGYSLQQHIVYAYGRRTFDTIELDTLDKKNVLLIRSLKRHEMIHDGVHIKITNPPSPGLLKTCAESVHCIFL